MHAREAISAVREPDIAVHTHNIGLSGDELTRIVREGMDYVRMVRRRAAHERAAQATRGQKGADDPRSAKAHACSTPNPSGRLPEKVLVEIFPGGPVEELAVDWCVDVDFPPEPSGGSGKNIPGNIPAGKSRGRR